MASTTMRLRVRLWAPALFCARLATVVVWALERVRGAPLRAAGGWISRIATTRARYYFASSGRLAFVGGWFPRGDVELRGGNECES